MEKQREDNDLLTGIPVKTMIEKAAEALQYSYSPYSQFKVSSALLTRGKTIYTGCNVENAAYSVCNCAERTALFKAVSEGEQDFSAICIMNEHHGTRDYCPPCGVCRQALREFCNPGTFVIILAKSPTDYQVTTLEQLLPQGFGPENIQ